MGDFSIIWKAVLSGLATGLLAALPLGPAALEAVKTTISRGYKQGFIVSLGAVTCDAFDIVLINFGILGILESNKVLESWFWIISGVLLCILGYISIARDKNKMAKAQNNIIKSGKIKSMPFISGFAIAFLNPLTHSFWLTMSGTVFRVWRFTGSGTYYTFIAFIIIGMLSWFTALNYLVLKGQKIVAPNSSEKLSKYLMWGIFIIGIGFAVYGTYSLLTIQ